MTTITGPNNWLLSVRREPDGAVLLRCATPDVCAALPDTLWSLPVTVLADHALALSAHSIARLAGTSTESGIEEIRITCGAADDVPWDNSRLRELTLPPALRRVENYALYHCQALERLRLHDSVSFWGSGILTGCTALHTIEITELSHSAEQGPSGGGALAYFAKELNLELDITVLPPDGSTSDSPSSMSPVPVESVHPTLRLLFPAYRESYEENTPAHHFDYVIEGTGYPYHHCFRGQRIHLPTYDSLWSRFRELGDPCALCLAWHRISCPTELSAEAKAAYWDYLRAHVQEAAAWLIQERDTASLAFLLESAKPGRDLFTSALSLARELENTEAAALLLEKQRPLSPAQDRFAL